MTAWVLVLILISTEGTSMTTVGYFETEQACETEGRKFDVNAFVRSTETICMQVFRP